jgi:hypothetical protein
MLLINLLRLLPRLGVMRLELLGERNSTEDSIYESAAAVLRDWPRNFHEMLRQYGEREVARGNGSYGIFKRFYGFLGPVLRLLRGDPARDWLRVEFAKFARENWGVLHRKGASKGVQNRFVSLSAYARNNGLTVASVKRLIQEDILTARNYRTGKWQTTVIDTAAGSPMVVKGLASKYISGCYDTLNQKEVRRELGITLPVLEELRKSGVFRVKDRKSVSERARRLWFSEDIETFREALLSGRRDEVPGEAVIRFTEIMSRTGLDKSAKCAIASALLHGRIQMVGSAGARLDELFLLRAQIEEVCRNRRRASYSFSEAGRLLGFRHCIVPEAIKAGFLVDSSCRLKRRVTAESVDRFLKEWLVLGSFARRLRVWRRNLERICQDLGVEVTFLRNASGEVNQAVIQRAREHDVVSCLRARREAIVRPAETKADRERRCCDMLSRYLENLKAFDRHLPRRSGIVSKLQVAKACGFNYNAWDNYPKVSELLRIADQDECRIQCLDGPGPLALLRRYLRQLAEQDERLPMRSKGKAAPNEWMIARLAGISSGVFRRDPSARKLLQEYRSAWDARHPERVPVRTSRTKTVFQ